MKYIVLIVSLAFLNTVQAQLYCTNYDVKDGLPTENITAIAEDSDGYIYVGTSMGLSYFDGVNFSTISEKGKGDIPYNVFVEAIRFDKKGNLWMSTEHNGVYRLEIQSNRWTNFTLDMGTEQLSPVNSIWDIEIVDNKVLVAYENRGLKLIDIHTLGVSDYDNLKGLSIRDIHKAKDGTFLITTNHSIYRLDGFNDIDDIDTLYEATSIFDLVESYILSDNSIYSISYTKGVFNIENQDILKISEPEKIDSWRYNFISEHDNKQWLTLKNYGLVSIDMKTNEWKVYESQPFSKNTLPKGKYNTGFKDSRNILWIATTKGLCSINPELQAFNNVVNELPTNEFLLDAIYDKDRSQYVMLYASERDKVKFFDEKFVNTISYNHTPNVKYIQSLHSLTPYKGNYYCLGHEIMHIDGSTGITSKATFEGLSNIKNPKALTIDDKYHLWIIDGNNKVIKYSLEADKISGEVVLPYLSKPSDFKYRIQNIKDCDKYISVSALDVFMLIDKISLQVYSYDVDNTINSITKTDQYPSKGGSITQVMEHDNSFFISSKNEGIYRANFSQETLNFTVTSSLSPSDVYGPVELEIDDENYIWIATDNGLVLTDNDLKIQKRLTSQHGLLKTKLSQGISIANGKVILQSENGISTANTNLLKKTNKVLPVDIKKLLINNELSEDLKKELELPSSQNNLQIYASIPLYGTTNIYTYLYRLLPLNKEWNEVEISQGNFRFDNLQSGTYTFEIKAKSGQSESNISKLAFTINPPFWKTWWFLLLAFLTLLSSATWMYKARVRNKVSKEKVKTKLAELQNEAIRAQLNPHFIFNALNSIRSLILMDKKEGSLTYLGRFSTLVREVLSISKEESITLDRELNFNENYVNIERLRFSQSLTYDVSIDKDLDLDHIYVPPLIMQPFIENAIWHGLLGKEENAILKVKIERESEFLIISIDDNGTGRKKKTIDKQNTYKTKKAYGELLSRQRLQSIGSGAEIKILDKVKNGNPSGTTVIIKLPLQS